ncbi:MAG: polyhydroxyalkanoate synthesis repressor PhaR [Alphaproteobacteria bacterium]|nr:polyhydroxyalkanoate synthesis repressor PhaR [Alphaproteobacteria bacterium]
MSANPSSATSSANDDLVIIKKYANRRLYNTETSIYVTLDDLCQMVKEGRDFVVQDAKTGEDITRSVLTQIIFEQEAKGTHLLPINFLRRMITLYDDRISQMVPHYLDASLDTFFQNQEKLRGYLEKAFNMPGAAADPLRGFSDQWEQIGKQNMELFQQTMKMFNPLEIFGGKKDEKDGK